MKRTGLNFYLILVIFIFSCGGRQYLMAPISEDTVRKAEFLIVPVFYATDRNVTGLKAAEEYYGSIRGDDNLYRTGIVKVTIPKTHEEGQIEQAQWWKFWNNNDPGQYFTIQNIRELENKLFFETVKNQLSKAREGETFVFIHGFNNSFQEAAMRTAQIAYDLNYQGLPVMFSWPCKGGVSGYMTDEATIEWATPHLQAFLNDLIVKTRPKKINIIAHSMGNRALTAVLKNFSKANSQIIFNQIVLAAPDVDAAIFKRDIAPFLKTNANRVTMYCSSKDKALIASKKVHTYIRAGESGKQISLSKNIETVDASLIDIDLIGHSYFNQSDLVLSDIRKLFEKNLPPTQRGLWLTRRNDNYYWMFRR